LNKRAALITRSSKLVKAQLQDKHMLAQYKTYRVNDNTRMEYYEKNVILDLKEGIIHLHFAVLCDILHEESKILGKKHVNLCHCTAYP